jgi:hypothetical protein
VDNQFGFGFAFHWRKFLHAIRAFYAAAGRLIQLFGASGCG